MSPPPPSHPLRGGGPPPEPWVSVDDVAAYLGIRKDSVYQWIARRGLPAQKIGKLWKLKLSEVDVWMRAKGQRWAQEPAPRPPADAPPRDFVLVVDDDEMVRESLRDFLVYEGYGVLLAADGVEALEILRAASAPRPCVIVLDLVMPRMGGREFLAMQANDPRLSAIPVLPVTAERRTELATLNVLRKPLDLAVLRRAIRGLVETR